MIYDYNLIQKISIWTLPVLSAIIFHEIAHGAAAKILGDRTAFLMGRLTLNPFRHVDLFGTIILPLTCLYLNIFIFGWAKPVPVNYHNLRNLKRDPALVALAGPVANLSMALSWAILNKTIGFIPNFNPYNPPQNFLISMSLVGIYFNCFLIILNLIPIPPLDGSKILSVFLTPKLSQLYNYLENYGFMILIILIYTNIIQKFIDLPLKYLIDFLMKIFNIYPY